MTSIPDHYAALGIDPTADPEVITAAYRALAKKFHPDTGAAAGTASPERFDEIQQAYEVLRTPESRHAYDLELLAATEAQLEQHLASKRRVVVRERQRAEQPAAEAAAAPDLGDIRPEPAVPPRARAAARKKPQRSLFPFAIPLVLMMAIGGGAAWLFLPNGPDAPPLPGSRPAAVVTAPKQAAPEAKPAQTAEAKPELAAPQPEPASEPPQQDTGNPVFGSTVTDEQAATIEEAAATPEPVPAPQSASAANSAAKSDKPTFGSSLDSQSPVAAPDAPADAAPLPPPVPKPRPAQPTRQALQQKPAAKPVTTQQQAQVQSRAKLQYQNPPQYDPQPDGYPAPGYEPPGYDSPYDPPPGYGDGQPGYGPDGGPYRLVIFERQPGQQATAWSAGMVFNSMGKCTRFGVKAVLRRTADLDPYADGTRVWYECQQLSQR